MIIINDLHIGVNRLAGTTVASRQELKRRLLEGLEQLLARAGDEDVCILGDLFDTARVEMADWLATYKVLTTWLSQSPAKLYLVAGNHDLSKNSAQVSSFQALAALLKQSFPTSVEVVTEPQGLVNGAWCIPHMVNQEEFDKAIASVPACDYLLLHCNYDNEFAQQADHSLNLSREQAEAVPVKHIIFAHEHQQRRALGGKVVVIGNQLSSSIADCLGNAEKSYLDIGNGEPIYTHWEWINTRYTEINWQKLDEMPPHDFIRVVGKAEKSEAAEVYKAISKFRDSSQALVVSNAVVIGESALTEKTLEAALKDVEGFNVVGALRSLIADAGMLSIFNQAVSRVMVKLNGE